MTRLTLEEFDGLDGSEWARSLASASGTIAAFMIEFKEAGFLGGPFAEKYALVTIRDHTNRPGPNPLRAETQVYNDMRELIANDFFKFPRGIAGRAGVTYEHEHISGRYFIETGKPAPMNASPQEARFFMTRNTLGGSATLDHPHLSITQNGSAKIDALDVVRMAREMVATMSQDEAVEALSEVERKIDGALKFYRDHEARSTPTIEKPVQLTVHGNDDSTWSRVFASIGDALAFADQIEANADVRFINDHLSFTN